MIIVHFKKCGLSYNKTFARHFKYELLYIYNVYTKWYIHVKVEPTSSQYYRNMTARYPQHAAPHISQ